MAKAKMSALRTYRTLPHATFDLKWPFMYH